MTTKTFRLYTYDTWGNADDGYEVNNVFRTIDTIDLDPSWDSPTILAKLWDANLIDHPERLTLEDPSGDGETFYVNKADDGKPLGELRVESEGE